jgi:O-antigen/teichoic acid export membrane protein
MIMLVASASGGILNYTYQILMGRMLGPEQYGVFGALISLTYILSVPVQTIRITTTKSITKLSVAGRGQDIGFLIRHLVARVTIFSILGLAAVLAASGLITQFFHIPSTIPVVVLAIAFFFQLIVPTFNGALLGLQRFPSLAVNQIANFGSKLFFGVLFVTLGFGVAGALAGMIIGSVLAIILGMYLVQDVLKRKPVSRDLPKTSSYPIYTLLAFLFITLLYNVDIILVKRFFDAGQAGNYAAAATLAKAIFFGSVAIAGAMFPKVSVWNEGNNEVKTEQLLRISLFYTALLAGTGTIVLNLFPRLVVSFLYGSTYTGSITLVGLLSTGMFFLSLSYVLVLYQLAFNKKGFLGVLAAGLGTEMIGIALFHATLSQVVAVFAGVMILVLLGLIGVVSHHRSPFSVQRYTKHDVVVH